MFGVFLLYKKSSSSSIKLVKSKVSSSDGIKIIPFNSNPEEVFLFKVDKLENSSSLTFIKDDGIWVSDIEGSKVTRLISARQQESIFHSISWSPDGDKLLFNVTFSPNTNNNGLYLFDSLENRIFKIAGGLSIGTWSTDGDQIAIFEKQSEFFGKIKILEVLSKKVFFIQHSLTQSFSGPLYWDGNNNIYFRMWIPVTYCEEATSSCGTLEKSREVSTQSIMKINLNTSKLETIVTRKLKEGGITEFAVIPKKDKLFFGDQNNKLYEVNLRTGETKTKRYEKMPNLFELTPSPDGDLLFMNDRMGGKSYVIGTDNREVIEFKSDIYGLEDWYSDKEVIAREGRDFHSTDIYWLINLDNHRREKLNITGNFVKVRHSSE